MIPPLAARSRGEWSVAGLNTEPGGRAGDPGTDGGGIFVAVQEQLGLKLQPARGRLSSSLPPQPDYSRVFFDSTEPKSEVTAPLLRMNPRAKIVCFKEFEERRVVSAVHFTASGTAAAWNRAHPTMR